MSFESHKTYSITCNQEELPFYRLQSAENKGPSFIIIDPWQIFKDYKPEISEFDLQKIGFEQGHELFAASIVTIRGGALDQITVNLAAPVIIDVAERKGRQAILLNHTQFSVKQPLIPLKAR